MTLTIIAAIACRAKVARRRVGAAHRGRRATSTICVAAAVLSACGDAHVEESTGADVPAEGVTVQLTATARQDGDVLEVTLRFSVSNATDAAVFVPDVSNGGPPAQLDGTTLLVRYDRPVGDPSSSGGDAPLPPTDGLVLEAGASLSGEAVDREVFPEGRSPTEADVCIEILADGFTVDEDGLASAPYRRPGEPAAVACSGPVPLSD